MCGKASSNCRQVGEAAYRKRTKVSRRRGRRRVRADRCHHTAITHWQKLDGVHVGNDETLGEKKTSPDGNETNIHVDNPRFEDLARLFVMRLIGLIGESDSSADFSPGLAVSTWRGVARVFRLPSGTKRKVQEAPPKYHALHRKVLGDPMFERCMPVSFLSALDMER